MCSKHLKNETVATPHICSLTLRAHAFARVITSDYS